MGLRVVVEDERGMEIAAVADPANILHRLLPEIGAPEYQCLNCVDRYGDTTFNRHQIPHVQNELQRLAYGNRNPEELELIRRIETLSEKSLSEPHLYLKFYGD